MRSFLILTSLALTCVSASPRLTCNVPHVGGGHDDGPAINAAFKQCAKGGKVVLDQYYSVDSLLFTTGLDDVEVELSGTGEQFCFGIGSLIKHTIHVTVQYTPDIAKWSPQSYYLTYQNS